jgi:hypothetical protein
VSTSTFIIVAVVPADSKVHLNVNVAASDTLR